MIKELGIGIVFAVSATNLYGMEMQDPRETETREAENDGIDHTKEIPQELFMYIISYITGLRVPQKVSAENKYSELEKGLKEAKKDIASLSLTDKYFKSLLDITNKESLLYRQHKCKLCPKEKPYTTAFYNALKLHKLQKHSKQKTVQWLRTLIQPLNAGRSYEGAQNECYALT